MTGYNTIFRLLIAGHGKETSHRKCENDFRDVYFAGLNTNPKARAK